MCVSVCIYEPESEFVSKSVSDCVCVCARTRACE